MSFALEVELEFCKWLDVLKEMLFKIEYVKDKMDPNLFGLGDSTKEDEDIDFLRYKSHHWEHEGEWRIWLPERLLDLVLQFNSISRVWRRW